MQKSSLFLLLLLVSGCASVGPKTNECGPNDVVIRYTPEQIDAMSDQQVSDNLAYNESLEKRGCAVPNKSK